MDDRKYLYDTLSKRGVNLGSYEEYDKNISDPNKAKWLYDKLTSDGINLGTYNEYMRHLGHNISEDPSASEQQNDSLYGGMTGAQMMNSAGRGTQTTSGRTVNPVTGQVSGGGSIATNREPGVQSAGNIDINRSEREAAEAEQRKLMRDYMEQTGQIDRIKQLRDEAQQRLDSNPNRVSWADRVLGLTKFVTGTPDAAKGFKDFFNSLFNTDVAADERIVKQAENALEAIDEAGYADKGFWSKQVGGVLRGVGNAATDTDTWDFGVGGISEGKAIYNILEKQKNGEELTQSEQGLLTMMGLKSYVDDAYGEEAGMGYKVGASLPESAGFMVQMYLNPLSGLGKKAGEYFGKAAIKHLANQGMSKALKKGLFHGAGIVGRVGGDLIEQAGTTLLPGAGRVYEDYLNRSNGQVDYTLDEEGNIQYFGNYGQEEDGATALAKAFGSNFIENWSEAVGEYFKPIKKGAGRLAKYGVKKVNSKRLNKLYDWVMNTKKSDFVTAMDKFKQKTKYDGLVGEYMEEVVGNVTNALTVEDNNFSTDPDSPEWKNSVFNREMNAETFLSCALMSGTMRAVEGGVNYGQRRYINKRLNDWENRASSMLGDAWEGTKAFVDNAEPSDVAAWLDIIREEADQTTDIERKKRLEEEIKAVHNYAFYRTMYQAYNARRLKDEENMTPEQKQEEATVEIEGQAEDVNATRTDLNGAAAALEEANSQLRQNLEEMLVNGNTDGEVNNIIGQLSEHERQLARAYVDAWKNAQRAEENSAEMQQQKQEEQVQREEEQYEQERTQRRNAYRDYKLRQMQLASEIGEDNVMRIATAESTDQLEQLIGGYTTEQKDAARALYGSARAVQPIFTDMQQSVTRVEEEARQQAERDYTTLSNTDSGELVQVTATGIEGPSYVTSGRLAFGQDEDGKTVVLPSESDDMVTLIDEKGNAQMTTPAMIQTVESRSTKEQYMQDAVDAAVNDAVSRLEAELETPDVPRPEQGVRFTMADDGRQYVIAGMENGAVRAYRLTEDATKIDEVNPNEVVLPIRDYYGMKARELWNGYVDSATSPRTSGELQATSNGEASGQGEQNQGEPPLPKLDDGTTDFDALFDQSVGRFYNEYAREFGSEEANNALAAKRDSYYKEAEKVRKKAEKAGSFNERSALNRQAAELKKRGDEVGKLIGTWKKGQKSKTGGIGGSVDMGTAPAADTSTNNKKKLNPYLVRAALVLNKYGYDEDRLKEVLSETPEKARQEVRMMIDMWNDDKKYRAYDGEVIEEVKSLLKGGNNPASGAGVTAGSGTFAADEAAARAQAEQVAQRTPEEQAAAQAAVQERIDREQAQREAGVEPAQRKTRRFGEEEDKLDAPLNVREYVAREIATGRATFRWDNRGDTKGLGAHTVNGEAERRQRIWSLNNKEGQRPEEVAERIHEMLPDGVREQVTSMDVFDIIIELMTEYDSPTAMWDREVRQPHAQMGSEELMPGYEEYDTQARMMWEAEKNGMSVEDWQSYNEYVAEQVSSLPAQEEIDNEITLNVNNYGDRRTETEVPAVDAGQGAQAAGVDLGTGERGNPQGAALEREPAGAQAGLPEGAAMVRQGDAEAGGARVRTAERGGQGNLENTSGRQQGDSAKPERVRLSDEVDDNGRKFVLSSDGTTAFGDIREDSGLPAAPIKLSEGYQDEEGRGYGLAHIEANHGEQIRNAGFKSVEDFVSFVANNYDEDNIRVGKRRSNNSTTYLIQATDSHDNTLFVELSRDGSYWNVNSGGVFRKGYSNKKETVAKTEPQQPNNAVSTGPSLSANESGGISQTEPNGGPTVSADKGNDFVGEKQEDNQEKPTISAKKASYDTNTGQFDGVEGYVPWLDRRRKNGEVIGVIDGQDNVDVVYEPRSGQTFFRVHVEDENAETPGAITEVLENEGHRVNMDGEYPAFLEYDTQEEATRMAQHIAEIQQRVDAQRAARQQQVSNAEQQTATQQPTEMQQRIDAARGEVNTSPTEGQKEAGNYRKGHVRVDGYDISIENPKGSVRSGVDANGQAWSVTMNNDYGYIRGTKAVDGDHIDVFLSDNPDEGSVFVVDQLNDKGEFDESKVMYGFNSREEAEKAYLSNYSEGWADRVMAVTEVSKEEFKKWIDSSTRKTKPFSEYKSVKQQPTATQNPSGNQLVSDERYQELLKRMRSKLGGQLNVGVDPELLAIGTEMAVYHIEKGARKFLAYAKGMIADIGDVVRPYLKAFYNGARDLPGMEEYAKEMTPYEEVSKIDVSAIGKQPTMMGRVEQVAREQEVQAQVEEVKKKSYSRKKHPKQGSPVQGDLFGGAEESDNTQRFYVENEGDMLQLRRERIMPDGVPVTDARPIARANSAQEMLDIINNPANRFGKELDNVRKALEAEIGATKTYMDNQGNPVDVSGKLIVERINSIDELTDEDFTNPTRSVELPKLPQNVDAAIGADGRPVIIKKNIFERNNQRHAEITPKDSKEILKSALYNPDLYGQNQKAKRPYNWVVINTKDESGKNRLVLIEVNSNKDNIEIVHWYYLRDESLETMKRQAEREGGLILILPSEVSEEAGGLSSRTPSLSSEGKGTESDANMQASEQENNEKDVSLQGRTDEQGGTRRTAPMVNFSDEVKRRMLDALEKGEKPFRSIVELRKLARDCGMEVSDEGRTDILIQELVEDGLVKAARDIAMKHRFKTAFKKDGAFFPKELMQKIVALYDMQPTIGQRSSNRIKMQQYSTPLPMSFVADMFVGERGRLNGEDQVLEPTAGNGMLVFGIPPQLVHANELDGARLANLLEQKLGQVTQQDATLPFEGGRKYGAVVANPPFGKAEPKLYDGTEIASLEAQIALNALESMKDDGRAAIIVGGNMEYQPNGAIKGADRAFYTYLYDHYNVKGVVDMDGGLYRKQGTTYPTRMILIEGRRSDEERAQETVYPPVREKAIPKAQSFEELYDIVNGLLNSNQKTNGTAVLHREQGLGPDPESRPGNGNDRPHHQQPPQDDREPSRGGRGGGQLQLGKGNGREAVLGTRGPNPGDGGAGRGASEAGTRGQRMDRTGVPPTDNKRVEGRLPEQRGVGLKPVERKRSLTDEKTAYRPHSRAFSLESMAPAAMTDAMDDALMRIEAEVGDIDTFVQNELGYDSVEALHNALAAEQVDSVAMAIYQMMHGEAMIIGDQTGVGKGRQMAALIRWAVKKGKKPVFITQKADLFSDLYRDLVDIGSGDLRPFIFNQDGDIKDAKNQTVYKPLSSEKMKKVLQGDKLPEGYDFVVLTYSQLNKGDAQSKLEAYEQAKKSGKRVQKKRGEETNAPSPKPDFLRKLAKGNIILLDESHTAAGDGNTGMYLQSITRDVEAATFASATFAKRPDTMPLYAIRTAMSKANVEASKLIEIIEKGGVTLQEIMSRALSAVGQMVRRERDMSDVKTDWKTVNDPATVERARSNYDRTVKAFNAIINFQNNFVKPYIEELSAQLAMQMKSAEQRRGTKDLGLTNVPFASKAYNYTKQLLLALKVDAIVDEVEQEIKAGRHPVIALESTMESVLDGYNPGDVLENATFGASLMKGLEKTLSYTVKDEKNKEEKHQIPLELLPASARQAYEEVKQLILESTRDVYVSPIDDIISKLNARGYSVGELTGRDKYVSMEDGRAVVRKRADKDKKRMTMEFNAGKTDVLILNKSASTGISLHASSRFSDQRQRTMVMAQPLSDINDYMQMIGRIDRTGQVHRGYYINLGLPVPAENRFMMMLSTKLKSLNANTTTSQDSKQNDVEAPDLLNKYGSQVVVEYLRDHPDVYEKMGSPLNLKENQTLENYRPEEDDARKVTGYVALLSVQEQEAFYDEVVERYNTLITQLNETDSNDLKIIVMPLKAKTLSKKVATRGNDPAGMNPFAKDSYVEEVEMDVLRKPWKIAEVKKQFDALQRGVRPNERVAQLLNQLMEETRQRQEAENARHEAALAGLDKEVEVRTDKIRNQKKLGEEEKRKAIEEERQKLLDKMNATHEKNLKVIDDQVNKMRSALTHFSAGQPYLIPDVLGTDAFTCSTPGMLIGFKTKEEGMTPSTSFAVFAVLDGRRKVEVKLSDTKALDAIRNHTMQNYDRASQLTVNNWDSQIPQTTRTRGFILTGNIIQAVSDSQGREGGFAGKLVSYTDENGDIHDGILMPQAWTPSLMKSAGTPINAVLRRITDGEEVKSIDGDVAVKRRERFSSYYALRVPKSRKKGGKYFLNEELLKLVDRDGFTQRGDAMIAYVDEKQLKKVLDLLSQMGVRVEDSSTENASEGGVKMQRAMGGSVSADLEQETALRDALVERLRESGIEVVTDAAEGQRVLDEAGSANDTRHFRSGNGEVYGFTQGGRIYLDPQRVNAETPIHEYAHLWAEALRKRNPEEWKSVVELMKDSPVWDEVKAYYPELTTDDELADEVLAQYSGRRGAEQLRTMQREVMAENGKSLMEKVNAVAALERLKDALKRFWQRVAELFNIHYKNADEVADRVLYDLIDGVNPLGESLEEVNRQFNKELNRYKNGEMASNEMLHLGNPYGVMKQFMPDLPIVMRQRILNKGSVKKHNVDVLALTDMPKHLSSPIFVFQRSDNTLGVLTEMQDRDGKKICVAIELDRKIQDGGEILEVNDVRSVHGRNITDIVYPIVQNGTLRWADKEKGLAYLSSASRYVQQEIDRQALDSAAKVVKDFENPSVEGENISDEEDLLFRVREEEAPEKTGIGYKVFVLKGGQLYPPMVANPGGAATPVGVWLDADAAPVAGESKTGRKQVKAGGKGTQGGSGKLAYRPGWHLGEIPYALQFNRLNPETGEKELFPKDFVWAEVEYADDVDYQEEAMSYGYNANGKFQHSLAGLPKLPVNGSYKYRTNPNPETDEWVITGAMKVNRILKPSEVDAMVREAGREPQRRQEGAVTDADVERLNEQLMGDVMREDVREAEGDVDAETISFENDLISKWMGVSRYSLRERKVYAQRVRRQMREQVAQMGKAMGVEIDIVESASELSGRRARAKGWYDRRTGRVTVVLGNHGSVQDIMKTVLHEAVAHYGLRKLFGDHFDDFLDNVFANASVEVRYAITKLAGKHGYNFRTATEEYMARLAEEDDVTDMNNWWGKVKTFFLRMLAKAGVQLNVELTDNELKYILWRSYQNLSNPGRYRSVIDEVKDVAMQAKLEARGQSRESKELRRLLATGRVDMSRMAAEEDGDLYREVEEVAEEFAREHKGAAECVAIRSVEDLERYIYEHGYHERPVTEDGYNIVEDLYDSFEKANACYDDIQGKVLMFATDDSENAQNTYLWHENVHRAVRELGLSDEDIDAVYQEINRMQPKKCEQIRSVYSEEDYKEEVATIWVHSYYNVGGDQGLLEAINNLPEQSRKVLLSIYNFVKYGTRNQQESTRREEGSTLRGDGPDIQMRDAIASRGVQKSRLRHSYRGSSQGFTSGQGQQGQAGAVVDQLRKAKAAQEYDQVTRSLSYHAQEAFQDCMLGLKKLQDILAKASGKAVQDYENAYMYENHLSSINGAEAEVYHKHFYDPMLEAMGRLIAKGVSEQEVYDYLMKKHAIERNREMAVREKLQGDKKNYKQNMENWAAARDAIRQQSGLSWAERQKKLDDLARSYGANIDKDYSGLDEIYSTIPSYKDKKASAIKEVEDMETKHGAETQELLDRIHKATQASLIKQRECGLMSKETFDQISSMYEYYVPLRGFEETTSEEMYDYVGMHKSGFNPVVKKAKGRTSKADNPIAYIGSMAESSIAQGNRNLMKQRFLMFVKNRPSDLVSVGELWLENDPQEGWIVKNPIIPENASPSAVQNIMEQFNEAMEADQMQYPDKYAKASQRPDIPYRTLKENLSQHQVIVKVNGKPVVITINGNPRAAQAVNGMMNPTANIDPLFSRFESMNRWAAANFTRNNPSFIAVNLVRDAIYTRSMVAVKESPKYLKDYIANWYKTEAQIYGLVLRYKNGTLDMSNKTDKMFHDFIMNGGETGYNFVHGADELKGEISKKLKSSRGNAATKTLAAVNEAVDTVNRWAEDVSRFAAYRTSIEHGRSIIRSIDDAKEVSVNFNRKGAGIKSGGSLGSLAQYCRSSYIFFNAGVQGMNNFIKAGKQHPVKFAALGMAMMSIGAFIPMLNAALFAACGGDDDDYWNIPEYVRRSNICFMFPGGKYITIPLPIELRAIYGIGEMATSVFFGKEEFSGMKLAQQVSQILPVDFLEGKGDNIVINLLPTYLKPAYEVYANESWTGLPIYKDSPHMDKRPSWTRAYKGTSPQLVDLCKTLSAATGGVDDIKRGWLELNPAMIEHLFQGYFGGVGKTINQSINSVNAIFNEDMREVNNIPVVYRFYKEANERTRNSAINRRFIEMENRYLEIRRIAKNYLNRATDMKLNESERNEYRERFIQFAEENDLQKMRKFFEYKKMIRKMEDYLKEDLKNEEVESQYYMLKHQMLDEFN